MTSVRRSRILGVGHHVPDRVVTNKDLEKVLDITDEAIVKRTGIRERRYAEPGTSCSDLAYQASLRALDKAALEPGDIELIILATLSPDHSGDVLFGDFEFNHHLFRLSSDCNLNLIGNGIPSRSARRPFRHSRSASEPRRRRRNRALNEELNPAQNFRKEGRKPLLLPRH